MPKAKPQRPRRTKRVRRLRVPECGSVCEHGDAEHDEDNNPARYDGSLCTCVRCVNFEVCTTWTKTGVCTGCRLEFGKAALVRQGVAQCPICTEDKVCYNHPSGCTHGVCGACLLATTRVRSWAATPADYGFSRVCACDDAPAEYGTATCNVCTDAYDAWLTTAAGMEWEEDAIRDEMLTVPCPICRRRAEK